MSAALSRAVQALLTAARGGEGGAQKFNVRWARWGSVATLIVPANPTAGVVNTGPYLANQLVRVQERRPRTWNIALVAQIAGLLPIDTVFGGNWTITFGVGQANAPLGVAGFSGPDIANIIGFQQVTNLPAQSIQVQFQITQIGQQANDPGGSINVYAFAAPVHHEGPDEWAV